MNLSVSQFLKRAPEVGLRKDIGTTKPRIIFQFLGGSVLLSLIVYATGAVLAKPFLLLLNAISA